MNERWIWAAIAVGAGLLLGAAVALVIRRQLSRAHRRLAIQEIAKPLSTFAFWIVFATGVLVAVAVSSPQHLETVPTELLAWLPRLAIAGLLVIGGYAVGLTIAAAVGRAVERVSGHRNRMLERTVRTVVLAGSLILALSQVGVDTTVVKLLIAGVVFATAAVLAGISVVGGRQVAAHVAQVGFCSASSKWECRSRPETSPASWPNSESPTFSSTPMTAGSWFPTES